MARLRRRVLVTGGAGFVGSHLVERLLAEGWSVRVVDDLSTGLLANLPLANRHLEFVRGDLATGDVAERVLYGVDGVFHLAANAEVRSGSMDPTLDFDRNLLATFRLLEAVRRLEPRPVIVFASSSTVYGEATVMPTPEAYGPLTPISVYGATKLGCEALLSGHAHTFDLRCIAVRFANVVGPRGRHGVIWDFLQKLRRNPRELEILGDGTQRKSYLHAVDCVSALLTCYGRLSEIDQLEVVNVGTPDQVSVRRIARLVCEAAGLKEVAFRFTGGIKGGRGWPGDVKEMLLDASKLQSWGWHASLTSGQAVARATRELIRELGLSW